MFSSFECAFFIVDTDIFFDPFPDSLPLLLTDTDVTWLLDSDAFILV